MIFIYAFIAFYPIQLNYRYVAKALPVPVELLFSLTSFSSFFFFFALADIPKVYFSEKKFWQIVSFANYCGIHFDDLEENFKNLTRINI